jgi:hypothetical protein
MLRRLLFALVLTMPALPAAAGDLTAFATFPSPDETWDRGLGAAFATTWFGLAQTEVEVARIPGGNDASTSTVTASAFLAPKFGLIRPYGGFGVGLFRQTIGGSNDHGTVRTAALGAKLTFALVCVRVEVRQLNMSGDPLLPVERRISVGAGLSF